MTSRQPAAPAFALLVPARGSGDSHLALMDGPGGFMCGALTGRKLFCQMGITDSRAGSCGACREAAAAAETR